MLNFTIVCMLISLIGLGVPVAFAMAISGMIGLYMIGGMSAVAGIVGTSAQSTVSSYELLTIPMFLLMAEFVLISRIANDLFSAAAAWTGRLRGGLGIATAIAGAGFAAICGSSAASAATLSSTSLPEMVKRGYDVSFACGIVAISGTLAMLIPPSIALVFYALLAETSVGDLLIAAIVPGIFICLTISLTIVVLVTINPSLAPSATKVPLLERLVLTLKVAPVIVLFGLVTGLIYTGVATPTEASAIGAIGALLLAIQRRRSFEGLGHAIWNAVRTSCMIGMILIGAHIFGYFFALGQLPQNLIVWVGELEVSRWTILIVILACYLLMGMILDQIAILVLTVPLVVPLMISLDFDLVWFGILIIVTAEIGMVTPPMGLNCFIVGKTANRPIMEVFRGTFPHVIAHILALAVLVAFPALALWLPSHM